MTNTLPYFLDAAYEAAIAVAGPCSDMLGFLRRVPGSAYHQPTEESSRPTELQIQNAIMLCQYAEKAKRW